MAVPPAGTIFQFRKGPDVQLARASGAKGSRVVGIDENGKHLQLPPERILQLAGTWEGNPADAEVREHLRALRDRSLEEADRIELELLWDTVREEGKDGAEIDGLIEVYLGRDGTVEEQLGLGYALCNDRVYFKQKGARFQPRMETEVRQRLDQLEAERLALEARARLLGWIHAALAGDAPAPPPEDAAQPLEQLVDLAVRGEESPHARHAKRLLEEVAESAPKGAPRIGTHPDGAFDLLVRLGLFHPHECLGIRRLGIPTAFPQAVLDAADATPPFDPAAHPGRRSLETLETLTIDNRDTTDRDDAVSVVPREGGGHTLSIHIADPTVFVPLGGILDEEAHRRGTSVYLPEVRYPMLPRRVSEELASLNAGGPRPAYTLEVAVAEDGALGEPALYPSIVRVDRNLSYEEADEAIARGEEPLRTLSIIAGQLNARRIARGALDVPGLDRDVRVDPETFEVTVEVQDQRSPAHAAIAELAILMNEEVARRLREAGAPAVFRRQAPPNEELPRPESAPHPLVWANEVRRRLQRTDVSTEPGPHAALGLDAYVQATSPIRRYQDLVHVRQLLATLRGEAPPYDEARMQELLGATEAASGEVGACERERIHYWLLVHLERHRKQLFPALALGTTRDGKALVLLTDLGLRFPLPRRVQPPAPGTALHVRVARVHARRGDLVLEPARVEASQETELAS